MTSIVYELNISDGVGEEGLCVLILLRPPRPPLVLRPSILLRPTRPPLLLRPSILLRPTRPPLPEPAVVEGGYLCVPL